MIHIDSLNCEGFQSYKKPSASLIQLFNRSLLGKWDEKNISQSRIIVREIQQSGKHIFVCAAGGSGAPTEVFRDLFSPRESGPSVPVLFSSVTEDRLNSLQSLDQDILKNSHWLFISKSGQTAESLFYAQILQKLGLKKKISLKDKIICLTSNLSSPLVKILNVEEKNIFKMEDSLPGRFSFFTLGGLVQSSLLGIDPSDLRAGFKNSKDSLAAEVLAHLMFQFNERKGKCFFSYSHSRFRALSLWWERSWSESLFKKEAVLPVPSLNSHSLSEICHAYLEELFSHQGCWIWDLGLRSSHKDMKTWKEERDEAFRRLAVREGCPVLSLSLNSLTAREAGALLALLFKTLYGLGEWLRVDLYKQPFVDQYKKEFSL